MKTRHVLEHNDKATLTVTVKRCPECAAPLVVENQTVLSNITISEEGRRFFMTAHTDRCRLGPKPI